jgi:glycosyltransferase A (GT-A) superfamily protein (DUF2064 family)
MVIAKAPVPGRVKTRLISDRVSPERAAELARAALLDTLSALSDFSCVNKVILFDGSPEDWLPADWSVQPQVTGGLAERLAAGFQALPPGPAILVGMDTPQVRPELLAFDPDSYDACLGLASDGGFWTIGFAEPNRARGCIEGVPMSEPTTGREQHRRLVAAGMSLQMLPELTDVDDAHSADEVAELAPDTRFARAWRATGSMVCQ